MLGGILVTCAIGSFLLLGVVSVLPQDYEKYNVSLAFSVWFVISLALLILGLLPLILGKYSSKYQRWVEKEVDSYKKWNEDRMRRKGEKLMKKR